MAVARAVAVVRIRGRFEREIAAWPVECLDFGPEMDDMRATVHGANEPV